MSVDVLDLGGRPVIIGGGIAGLMTALHLAPEPVLLLSRSPLGADASSVWAQGGLAARNGMEMQPAISDLTMPKAQSNESRRMWTLEEARALHDAPFNGLLFQAQTVHRQNFDPNKVQLSRLLSIKTGGCPEDCGYCSQSAQHETGLKASKLMEVRRVIAEATKARDAGATRYCMGAAWRNPKARDMDAVVAMVEGVKALGMETCMTLGMLDLEQASRLKQAGLDYYNHNIDTSERYYSEVISTRTFADRLDTLANVRDSGIKVCCGGIVGMGEEPVDRIDMERHPRPGAR